MTGQITRHRSTEESQWEQEMRDLFRQMIPQDNQEKSADLGNYLDIIWRRKWHIIIPLLIIPIMALFIILVEPPTYEATAALLIEAINPKIVQFEEVLQQDRSREYFQTQYVLIKSRDIAEKVVDALYVGENSQNLDTNTDSVLEESQGKNDRSGRKEYIIETIDNYIRSFLRSIKGSDGDRDDVSPSVTNEIIRRERINELIRSTFVQPVPHTRLVNITISGRDPYEVTDQVNTLAKIFVAQNLENKRNVSKEASEWLKEEVAGLKEELKKAEFALIDFVETNNFIPLNTKKEDETPSKKDENQQLHGILKNIKIQKFELENKLRQMSSLVDNPDTIENFPASTFGIQGISMLQEKRSKLKDQYDLLSKSYTNSHPKIRDILEEMDQIKSKSGDEIKSQIVKTRFELKMLNDKDKYLESFLSDEKKEEISFNKDEIVYNLLQRNIENKRNLYQSMQQRLNETEITKGLQTNNIMIAQKAVVPLEPVPSKKKKKLAISVVLALGVGFGLTFLSEMRNKRFHNPSEVQQYMNTPFLGMIPHNRVGKRRGRYALISQVHSYSPFSNAYRHLRTRILFQTAQNPIGSLLVTSTSPGEGKSITAANLAISFAQLGKSVMLVDTNLRNPALHRIFGLVNHFGLSDVLVKETTWGQVIQQTSIENLQVITSGPSPYNPVELLSMRKMSILCEQLKDAFDVVIYDTSQLLGIPDASILATEMDEVLFVHNPERVHREMAIEAKGNLDDARASTLGVVFNNIKKVTHRSNSIVRYIESNQTATFPATDKLLINRSDNYSQPAQNSMVTLLQEVAIEKTIRDKDFVIMIKRVIFQEEVSGIMAEKDSVFIILELELINCSSSPLSFRADMAKIYLKDMGKYSVAIRKIYKSQNEDNLKVEKSVYYQHVLNGELQENLKDIQNIDIHQSVTGKLIYKVPRVPQGYIFEYHSHDSRTVIPLPSIEQI